MNAPGRIARAVAKGLVMLFGAVLVLAMLAVVAVQMISDRTWLKLFTHLLEQSAGYTLRVDGDFQFKPTLRPELWAEDISMFNPARSSNPELVRIQSVAARVELIPLLGGKINFALHLTQPELALERYADGAYSWERAGDGATRGEFEIAIIDLRISDAGFRYTDHGRGWDARALLDRIDIQPANDNYDVTVGGAVLAPAARFAFDGNLQMDRQFERVFGRVNVVARNPDSQETGAQPVALRIEGSAGISQQAPQADLRVAARVKDFEPLAGLLPGEFYSELVPAEASARFTLTDGVAELTEIDASAGPPEFHITLQGSVLDLAGQPQLGLAARANIDDAARLPEIGEFNPDKLATFSPLRLTATLSGGPGNWRAENLQVIAGRERLQVQGTGFAALSGEDIDANIRLEASAESIFRLPGLAPAKLERYPKAGPVTASGELIVDASGAALRELQISLRQPTLTLTAHGAVEGLDTEPQIQASIQAQVAELHRWAELLELPAAAMPDGAGLAVAGAVSGRLDDLALQDIEATLSLSEWRAGLRGQIRDLTGHPVLDLDVDTRLESPARLGNRFGWPLPEAGAAAVRGRLTGSGRDVDLTGLHVGYTAPGLQLMGQGSISRLFVEPQFNVEFSGAAKSLTSLAVFPIDVDSWPKSGELRVGGRLTSNGGAVSVGDIYATLKDTHGQPLLTADGAVAVSNAGGELKLHAEVADLGRASNWLGIPLPVSGAASVEAGVRLEKNAYLVDAFNIRIGKSDLRGKVAVRTGGAVPDVAAELTSGYVDFDQLLGWMNQDEALESHVQANTPDCSESDGQAETDDPPPEGQPQPLDLTWLDRANLGVALSMRRAKLGDYDFRDLDARLVLRDGNMILEPFTSGFGTGKIKVRAEISRDQSLPRFFYRIDSDNVEIADLLDLPEGVIQQGVTFGTAVVEARGQTVEELLASLKGGLLMRMGPAQISDAGLSLVSTDIVSGVLRGITSTKDKDPATAYRCGVFGVSIQDGIARIDNSIALQATRFNISAKGDINLPERTINIRVRPRATKGLGFSVASVIGGFVVSGDLASPQINLSISGLATSALFGLWNGPLARLTSGRYTCDKTLARISDVLEQTGYRDRVYPGLWEDSET